MRIVAVAAFLIFAFAGCAREEEPVAPPLVPAVTDTTTVTATSGTITPGTSERAATATGTIAPETTTRTTTSAPPGTTATRP